MFKKALTSLAVAGLVFGHTAAAAAPVRTATPVSESENLTGVPNIVLVLAFAALAIGIILIIEGSESEIDDLPSSP